MALTPMKPAQVLELDKNLVIDPVADLGSLMQTAYRASQIERNRQQMQLAREKHALQTALLRQKLAVGASGTGGMGRADGTASEGGAVPAGVKTTLMTSVGPKGISYWNVPGKEVKEREANLKHLMESEAIRAVAADPEFQAAIQKMDGASVRKQQDILRDLRRNHIKRLSEEVNLDPKLLTQAALSGLEARVQEQQKSVNQDAGFWNSLRDQAHAGLIKLGASLRTIGKSGNEANAIMDEAITEAQAVLDANAFLKDRERMEQEGYGIMDQASGAKLATLGSLVGGELSDLGLEFGGAALGGAIGALAGPAGALAGGALGGAATGAISERAQYLERAASDPSQTEAQQAANIEGGTVGAAALGAALGGIPLNVGRLGRMASNAAVRAGMGKAGREVVEAAQKQAAEAAGRVADSPMMQAMTPSPSALRGSIVAEARQEAYEAYLQRLARADAERGRIARMARGAVTGGIEGLLSNAGSALGQNALYGSVSGQDIALTGGLGEALYAGGISGAVLGGMFGLPRVHRRSRAAGVSDTTPGAGDSRAAQAVSVDPSGGPTGPEGTRAEGASVDPYAAPEARSLDPDIAARAARAAIRPPIISGDPVNPYAAPEVLGLDPASADAAARFAQARAAMPPAVIPGQASVPVPTSGQAMPPAVVSPLSPAYIYPEPPEALPRGTGATPMPYTGRPNPNRATPPGRIVTPPPPVTDLALRGSVWMPEYIPGPATPSGMLDTPDRVGLQLNTPGRNAVRAGFDRAGINSIAGTYNRSGKLDTPTPYGMAYTPSSQAVESALTDAQTKLRALKANKKPETAAEARTIITAALDAGVPANRIADWLTGGTPYKSGGAKGIHTRDKFLLKILNEVQERHAAIQQITTATDGGGSRRGAPSASVEADVAVGPKGTDTADTASNRRMAADQPDAAATTPDGDVAQAAGGHRAVEGGGAGGAAAADVAARGATGGPAGELDAVAGQGTDNGRIDTPDGAVREGSGTGGGGNELQTGQRGGGGTATGSVGTSSQPSRKVITKPKSSLPKIEVTPEMLAWTPGRFPDDLRAAMDYSKIVYGLQDMPADRRAQIMSKFGKSQGALTRAVASHLAELSYKGAKLPSRAGLSNYRKAAGELVDEFAPELKALATDMDPQKFAATGRPDTPGARAAYFEFMLDPDDTLTDMTEALKDGC